MLRWELGAGTRPRLPQPAASRRGRRHGELGLVEALVHEAELSGDQARVARAKYAGAVLEGVAVVAAAAKHPKRAEHLVGRVVAVMRSRQSAYGRFGVRRYGAKRVGRLLARRRLLNPSTYAPSELAGIIGVPIEAPRVPGLVLGTGPVLLPSPRIPSKGLVLAESTWPGRMRPLAQPVVGALNHTLIAGPSGVGKSHLMTSIAVQHWQAGAGLLVVDGKGDLVNAILSHVPEGAGEVIVLDLGSSDRLPGLRLFGRGTDPESTAELVLGILADVFASSWGPLSSRWLRAALIAVAHDGHGTLADVPFVFSDDAYRRRLLARIKDPLLRNTFAAFENMGAQERAHQLSAPLGKLEEIIGRRVARTVLAQPRPSIDMADVLRTGKVVLVSLAPGRVGAGVSRLVGALAVFQLFAAVQARASLPAAKRRPFFFLCDEPAVLGDMPVPIDSLYELGRGLACGVLLSVQSLSQLKPELRAAATTNAATWVVFRQSSADARLLAPDLPGVRPEALGNLAAFEAVLRIGLGPGDVAAPATGRTYPLPPPTSDPEVVRRLSAERYGADPAEVDAALAARHGQPDPETPVGRARRAS